MTKTYQPAAVGAEVILKENRIVKSSEGTTPLRRTSLLALRVHHEVTQPTAGGGGGGGGEGGGGEGGGGGYGFHSTLTAAETSVASERNRCGSLVSKYMYLLFWFALAYTDRVSEGPNCQRCLESVEVQALVEVMYSGMWFDCALVRRYATLDPPTSAKILYTCCAAPLLHT